MIGVCGIDRPGTMVKLGDGRVPEPSPRSGERGAGRRARANQLRGECVTRTDPLEQARAVADAVLYEGYRLHPYRAPVAEDQLRWQVGVVGPAGARARGRGEDSRMSADCLLDVVPGATVDVQLRFLQHQARTIWQLRAVPGEQPAYAPVAELTCDAQTWRSWGEAVEHAVELPGLRVHDLLEEPAELRIEIPGGGECDALQDEDGALIGKVARERWPLTGVLRVGARRHGPVVVLQLRFENLGTWVPELAGGRDGGRSDRALWASFLSTHMVAAVRDGQFLPLNDPPEWAASMAAGCESHRCWPVLVGSPGDREVVLASPVVLHDWPEVGALVDSISVDELLALRSMTPSEGEDAGAAGSFPVDLDGVPSALIPVRRSPGEQPSTEDGAGNPQECGNIEVGDEVRLRPSFHAEARNLVAAGQIGVVTEVHHDDGGTSVSVVLDDDPCGADTGWSLRFGIDEVEPLEP